MRIAGIVATFLIVLAAVLAAPATWAQETAAPEAAPAEVAAPTEAAPAAEAAPEYVTAADAKVVADTIWVYFTALLVIFMNTGFALLESGLCRAKNCVNILAKNFIVYAIAALVYWAVGFGLMFGDGNAFVGMTGWFLKGADNSPALKDAYQGVFGALSWTAVPLLAKFLFQMAFAATAATIVSGAVAERIKFGSFMVFSVLITTFLYPVTGHWIWGGGWLAQRGFLDFAGSTVVHSVGGWAALAGILLLGPRIGKYDAKGGVTPIPGHSMTSATLGTFILWLGWFGFNPGSTMAADPAGVVHIAMTTNTAGCAGAVAATLVAWGVLGKPDLSMTLNGCLAGLVAITAPCAFVSVEAAAVIGAVAGVLVVYSVLFWDKVKVDDPVGALSVHLVNGIWGTLSLGIFAKNAALPSSLQGVAPDGLLAGGGPGLLVTQATGVVAVGAFTFLVAIALWGVLKATMGIRVSPDEEREGLDMGEHGIQAYPDFQVSSVAK